MKRLLFAALALAMAAPASVQAASAASRAAHPHGKGQMRRVAQRPKPTPSLKLSGQVFQSDGSPAPGAAVYLSWMTQSNEVRFAKVAVDAGGHFDETAKLNAAPRYGSIGLTAYLPGKGTAWHRSTPGSSSFTDLKLRLQPGVTLSGRLIRSSGNPAANIDLHVQALFPQPAANMPGIQQQMSVSFGGFGGNASQLLPYDYLMRLLPDDVMPGMFRTQTDVEGRFTLTGLPPQMSLLLQTGSGLVLTPNSMAPLQLNANAHQEAGVLVAMQTGSARIHILNSETHRPEPSVQTIMMQTDGAFSGPVFYHHQPPFNVSVGAGSDQNGVIEAKNMLPGTYKILISGREQEVKIEEGKAAPPVELTLRQGPLNGRLLDASGKPLANVAIMMNATSNANFPQISFGGGRGFQTFNGFNGFGAANGWEKRPIAQTGSDGSFVLPQFPWGSDRVIIRATKRNDRAEYIGPISGIGKTLELRMKPNALISVTGRLIDPHRRPVTGLICQALHWQSSPRPTWFGSAHEVRADAQGRFHVEGLERGESFSILSNGQRFAGAQQQAVVNGPTIKLVSHTVKSPVNDFESPRFVTGKEGAAQDLGDIMVHPSSTQDEVFQSYGVGNREIANSGVLESSGASTAEQAKAALKRYHQTLQSGDVKTAHRLASHLSPGYSRLLPEFLLHASLQGRMAEGARIDEAQSALRFIPRALIGMMAHGNIPQNNLLQDGLLDQVGLIEEADVSGNFIEGRQGLRTVSQQSEGDPADSAQEAGKRWVFLTAKRSDALVLAGVLHQEEGQWRVVFDGLATNLPFSTLMSSFGGSAPEAAHDTTKASSLPLEQFASARQAGERYLHLWAENRPEALLAATSPYSFSYARDLAHFKKRQEHRPDEGLCPLAAGSAVALQPLPDLTLWDQKWLTGLARLRGFSSRSFNDAEGNSDMVSEQSQSVDALFPKGEVVLLQYSVPNGRFLMALIKQKGQWKMLEPALPL